jgi:putative transposase
MVSAFCVEAWREALSRYGSKTLSSEVRPEIFNTSGFSVFDTDQGSQSTSEEFTGALSDAGVRISMDGKGRWMDNVFIERLWRSLKYECVYLREFETGEDAKRDIGNWLDYYNMNRPHSSLADKTPMEVHLSAIAA